MISTGNNYDLMIWVCLIKNKNAPEVLFKSVNYFSKLRHFFI